MDLSHDRRFIESKLPLAKLNELSVKESGFKGAKGSVVYPRVHNIHTWFARRPAGPARVLTLASILPESVSIETFNRVSSIDDAVSKGRIIYMVRPRRELVWSKLKETIRKEPMEVSVCDPMAGGGSIPLESLRLGFRTIAVEYNPVAYLILKATLEFPAKYADSGLFEEALKVSRELNDKVRDMLGKYFGNNAKRYIFARGIKCPFCSGLIPVQSVTPQITKAEGFKRTYLKLEFDKEKKVFTAETTEAKTPNPIEKREYNIRCPYCGKWFQLKGRAKSGRTPFDEWFQEHARFMRSIVEELEQTTPEMEERLLELHVPLVKQAGDTFVAIWNDGSEKEIFKRALRDLSNEILELLDYIPADEIPRESRWASAARNKGLTHWYMLFNPRQLLTIAKLSKIVAETAEKLTSRSGEFGAAVALYLALAIDKIADYNTIATKWQGSAFKTGIGNTLRGESTIDFRNEYCEMGFNPPELSLGWALEPDIAASNRLTSTAGGVLPVLRFLADEFRGAGLGDRVAIYLADATKLSEVLGVGTVDVVNVDPPYFEQVIYSDRSEFFWVILRRALRPVLEMLFRPGLRLSGWSWTSPSVPREREVVAYDKEDSDGRFRRFFKEFVRETYRVLKDDGVLVLWFTHPTDIAWRTVGEALYEAGYVVSKVWPLKTEMRTRYKRQVNVIAQETSLIIVARKYPRKRLLEVSRDAKRSLLAHPELSRIAEEVVEDSRKLSKEVGANPADMMALMLGSALAIASRFEVPGLGEFDQLFDASSAKVNELVIAPLLRKVLAESGPVKLPGEDVDRVLDYVRRAMLRDEAARSYITLWFLSRVDLDTGRCRSEPLPLSYDFAQTVAKVLGYDIDKLRESGLVGETVVEWEAEESSEREDEGGRKGKTFYPLMFEAFSPADAKTTWAKLSSLLPGRAIYLAYLALNETGAPAVRASSIKRRLSTWSTEELAESAALAVVLLETARDVDLGLRRIEEKGLIRYSSASYGSREALNLRELAIRTLLHLLPR